MNDSTRKFGELARALTAPCEQAPRLVIVGDIEPGVVRLCQAIATDEAAGKRKPGPRSKVPRSGKRRRRRA